MTDIDLTCAHPRRHFATLGGGRYIAHCANPRCHHIEWDTDPISDAMTVETVLDIYERAVELEAACDELTSPVAIAFAARLFMARAVNTEDGRAKLAAGMWLAVHPTRHKVTGTTSADCAQTLAEHRLYVIGPHVWDEAVRRVFTIWEADLRDSGK
jgi:hypothetical protein